MKYSDQVMFRHLYRWVSESSPEAFPLTWKNVATHLTNQFRTSIIKDWSVAEPGSGKPGYWLTAQFRCEDPFDINSQV